MKYKINKIDVAVDQLDWAIKLFLDQSAYVSSITLAGTAKEIIGGAFTDASSILQTKDSPESLKNNIGSILSQVCLGGKTDWITFLKNMGDHETTEVELETEAIQLIVRGITSLFAYDQSLSSESPRFLEWLNENRPEILNNLEFLK